MINETGLSAVPEATAGDEKGGLEGGRGGVVEQKTSGCALVTSR